MKKAWKRIVTLALALVMTVSVLPVQASAASISVPSTYTITKYSSKDYNVYRTSKMNKQYFTYVPGNVTKLKSSNKKVVTVSKTKGYNGSYSIYLTAKKSGTATVSFKYKGKTYKTKVTVVKYQNPISSVKIGSKTIKGSKFDSTANCSLKYSKFKNKKVKVTVKLKSGWTLGYGGNNKYSYWRKGWQKTDEKANGKKVTVKGGKGFAILLPVTNTKTGVTEEISIYFK